MKRKLFIPLLSLGALFLASCDSTISPKEDSTPLIDTTISEDSSLDIKVDTLDNIASSLISTFNLEGVNISSSMSYNTDGNSNTTLPLETLESTSSTDSTDVVVDNAQSDVVDSKDDFKTILDEAMLHTTNKISITLGTLEEEYQDLYTAKLLLTYKDTSYDLYISEENIEEKEEVDGEEIEKTTSKKYVGVIKKDDAEYEFTAFDVYEEETKGDSLETESTLRLVITLSDTSKIIVKQEKEVEGNEVEECFSYVKIENNKKIEKYKVSKEEEQGIKKIKIEVDRSISKFEFYTLDDTDYVKYSKDRYFALYKIITDENNNTTYELIKNTNGKMPVYDGKKHYGKSDKDDDYSNIKIPHEGNKLHIRHHK